MWARRGPAGEELRAAPGAGPRGLFITGTGTGVGKTVVSAALAAALISTGRRVAAYKPVVTGIDEPASDWLPDHELLALVTGQSPDTVCPIRFGPAVSPHLAAGLAGDAIAPAALRSGAQRAAVGADLLIVEGVGGLLVPLAPGYSVRDLASDLGLPLIVVASPGLGTINHTLLTVDSARSVGLEVAAVVLTPWPAHPSVIEASNLHTIEQERRVEVLTLPVVASSDPAALAEAAGPLAASLFRPGGKLASGE